MIHRDIFESLDWTKGKQKDCSRIRCLDSRQTSLQSYSEDRVVPQLVQPVVVIPKLLDEHFPACWVQKILRDKQRRIM